MSEQCKEYIVAEPATEPSAVPCSTLDDLIERVHQFCIDYGIIEVDEEDTDAVQQDSDENELKRPRKFKRLPESMPGYSGLEGQRFTLMPQGAAYDTLKRKLCLQGGDILICLTDQDNAPTRVPRKYVTQAKYD